MQELFNAVPELKFYFVVMELIFHAIGIGRSIYVLVMNIIYAVTDPCKPYAFMKLIVPVYMSAVAVFWAVMFYNEITAPIVDYATILMATIAELIFFIGFFVFTRVITRAMQNRWGGNAK